MSDNNNTLKLPSKGMMKKIASMSALNILDDPEPWCGVLYKKGSVNKAWKARYFVLLKDRHKLLYYASQQDFSKSKQSKCGTIDLTTIHRIEITNDNGVFLTRTVPEHIVKKNKAKKSKSAADFTFQLVSSGRTWVLHADESRNFVKWLKHLQTALYGGRLEEGFVHKLGAKNKSWKRRYFVLNEWNFLKYYADESCDAYLGHIYTGSAEQMKCQTKTHMKYPHILEIDTKGRVWYLGFTSQNERDHWFQQICSTRMQFSAKRQNKNKKVKQFKRGGSGGSSDSSSSFDTDSDFDEDLKMPDEFPTPNSSVAEVNSNSNHNNNSDQTGSGNKKNSSVGGSKKRRVIADLNCVGNHGLKVYDTQTDNFCNVCSAEISAGYAMFGCRVCDWDACFNCYREQRVYVVKYKQKVRRKTLAADENGNGNENENENNHNSRVAGMGNDGGSGLGNLVSQASEREWFANIVNKANELISFNCNNSVEYVCNVCSAVMFKEMPMFTNNDQNWIVCYQCHSNLMSRRLYRMNSIEIHEGSNPNIAVQEDGQFVADAFCETIERINCKAMPANHNASAEAEAEDNSNGAGAAAGNAVAENEFPLRFNPHLRTLRYWPILFEKFKKLKSQARIRRCMNEMMKLLNKSIDERQCYFEPVFTFICAYYIVCSIQSQVIKETFANAFLPYSTKIFDAIQAVLEKYDGSHENNESTPDTDTDADTDTVVVDETRAQTRTVSEKDSRFIQSMLGWWYASCPEFPAFKAIATQKLDASRARLTETYNALRMATMDNHNNNGNNGQRVNILAFDLPSMVDVDAALAIPEVVSQRELHPHVLQFRVDVWLSEISKTTSYDYEFTLVSQWLQNYDIDASALKDFYESKSVSKFGGEAHMQLNGNSFGLFYFLQIAEKIHMAFEALMRQVFNDNRTKNNASMNLSVIADECMHNESGVGVHCMHIKTLYAALRAMKNTHSGDDYPRAGSILDYIRCVLVVEHVTELEFLLHTLCELFHGKIVNIKNTFHSNTAAASAVNTNTNVDTDSNTDTGANANVSADNNVSIVPFGYRCVLLHVVCSDETDPLLAMICEIEVTTLDFWQISQQMQIYEKFESADNAWNLSMAVIEEQWAA